nr:hypothetical protein [Tanacetum cinerariifolium]
MLGMRMGLVLLQRLQISMISQEEEARIQSTQEEFEFMAVVDAYKETERVKVSTSGTQSDKAPEQYTELLEPIPEPHQVSQNNSNVIYEEDELLVKQIQRENKIKELDNILVKIGYNDMQQKIERLQAQLGDQKGKSKDTSCVSNTFDPLSQKLENVNVELEFQVRNYEKKNAHLKTTYKNLFDSISMTRDQTKTIIDSLQTKLHDTIYKNAKLRAQLFDKVSRQNDTTRETSANTKFAKQSILGKPPSSSRHKLYAVTPLPKSMIFPKVGETHALSNPVTSNSVPTPHRVINYERDFPRNL